MKVLIIHTYYISRGGEDLVFETESKFLSGSEIEVLTLPFYNANWTMLKFILYPFNIFSFFKTIRYLKKNKPDLVHVHNWHFSASPSVIVACKLMKVPIVQTLHNHRLINYKDIKNEYSKGLSEVFETQNKRKSTFDTSEFQNFMVQICCNLYRFSGIWKWVDRYIVLTEHSKHLYGDSHFKPVIEKFRVKSNFIDGDDLKLRPKKDHFLYVGRLTYEKGAHILLSAFEGTDLKLKIIGDGPLKKEVKQLMINNPNIEYLGFQDFNFIKEVMSESIATIFPSITLEGMPMTIIESFACGTPVVASRYSAMQNMIKDGYNGYHFEIGHVANLREIILMLSKMNQEEIASLSANARQSYMNYYSPGVNIDKLISIYKEIIS